MLMFISIMVAFRQMIAVQYPDAFYGMLSGIDQYRTQCAVPVHLRSPPRPLLGPIERPLL